MRKNKMTALLSLACAATLAAGVGVVAMNNLPVAEAETAHTEAIFMANGASIRYSNPSGIRFVGYVDEDVYTEGSVVGMKITVGGVEKVFSTETIEGASWQWTESDVAGYKKFNVAITEIPASAYETEMTAQAFVGEETSAEIVTRSIANVAVAALAADTLEDKLLDTNVTKLENYVNDAAVALPFDATEVSVTGGNLTFDAVENAKGYLVQFGNEITNIPATSAETYSVPVGDFEGTIKMLPYGDGVAYRYAETAFSTTHVKMLASFDDASYVNNVNFVQGNRYSAFKETPTFEKDGTPTGTVTFGVSKEDYHSPDANWSNVSPFTVTLPNAIDLNSGYDGIQIRLYLNWVSQVPSGFAKVRLEMLNSTPSASWNDKNGDVGTAWFGDGVQAVEKQWMTLEVSNAQLEALGYKTGDTVLTFAIRVHEKTNASGGGSSNMSIDYVKYYTNEEVLLEGLAANELANFDYQAYTSAIDYIGGQNYTTFVTAPSYADGKVSFTIRNDDYRDPHADWTNIAVFKVTLPKALDTTKGDGITVKLYVNEATQAGKLGLELLDDSKMTSWCTTKSSASVTIGEDDVANTGWLELFVSNAQLEALGYATGDTTLTFGLRNASNGNHYNAYSWNVSIDYIKYYDATDLLGGKLAEGELANFNEAAYTSILSVVPGEVYSDFRTAPSYADGVVSFCAWVDEHRKTGGVIYNNFTAINVALPKALDLDNGYDGIKIRAYAGYSHCGASDTVKLELFARGKNTTWRAGTASVQSEAVAQENWIEFTITNEQLAELGYKTGDTALILGFRTTTMANGNGYYINSKIDYINYYKAES